MAKISIVIPLYNKAPHILRAIDSVLGQTEQDFEIIVVNDASTDGGEKLVESLKDNRIRIYHRNNLGPGGHAARNKGIEEASSNLIAFLDADDEWKSNFLETILCLYERYPEAGAYGTAWDICKKGKMIRLTNFKTIPAEDWEGILPNYFRSKIMDEPIMWTSTICVPKKIFYDVGFFPVGEKVGGDLDMWGRIALRYPIVWSKKVCAIYHRDAVNRICLQYQVIEPPLFVKTAEQAIASGAVRQELLSDLREYIAKERLRVAWSLIVYVGNIKKAREVLFKCNTSMFYFKKLLFLFLAFFPINFLNLAWKVKNMFRSLAILWI